MMLLLSNLQTYVCASRKKTFLPAATVSTFPQLDISIPPMFSRNSILAKKKKHKLYTDIGTNFKHI